MAKYLFTRKKCIQRYTQIHKGIFSTALILAFLLLPLFTFASTSSNTTSVKKDNLDIIEKVVFSTTDFISFSFKTITQGTSHLLASAVTSVGSKIDGFFYNIADSISSIFSSKKENISVTPTVKKEETKNTTTIVNNINNPTKTEKIYVTNNTTTVDSSIYSRVNELENKISKTPVQYPVVYQNFLSNQVDSIYSSVGKTISNTTDSINTSINSILTNGTFNTPTFTGTSTADRLSLNDLSVNNTITLSTVSPSVTTDKLYQNGGLLYWSGNLIGGATTGVWSSNGTDVWRATGNVGVGTSSPNAKLDVWGNLTVGTSSTPTLSVNTATGKVAIGKLTPGAPLDVKSIGQSTVSGIRLENQNDANITATLYEITSGNGALELRRGGLQNIRLSAGSNGISYLGTSNNGGNVGINTTTPYATLTISGNTDGVAKTATTTLAIIPSTGQTANIIDIYNTSGILTSVLSASGNLGVGSTSPSNKLEVAGNGYFAGSLTSGNVVATGTVSFTGNQALTWGQFSHALTEIGNQTGGSVFVRTSAGGGYDAGLGIDGLQNSLISNININALGVKYSGYSSKLNFNISNGTATTTALSLDSNGITTPGVVTTSGISASTTSYFAGNVGIGYPANDIGKLIVSTTSSPFALDLMNPGPVGASTGILFGINGNPTTAYQKGGIVYTRTGGSGEGDFHFLQNSVADSSNVSTAQSVMTIKNNGNVGVGTTTPSSKLDVGGTSGFNTTGYNFNVGDFLIQPYAASNGFIANNAYYNGGYKRLNAGYAAGLQFVGGQVVMFGADTSTAGSAFTQAINFKSDWSNSGTVALGGSINGSIGNYTGATLVALGTGNVGIGTVAPSAKLEVSGTSGIFVSDATRVSTLILNSNLADNRIYSSYTSGSELPLYLGTYSKQTAITVQPTTGNVGIGTTSPSAKLSIKNNLAGAGSSILRLDNSGTVGNEVGLDFYSSPTNDTGSYRSGRIYSKFDDISYPTSRLTFQSMTAGDTLVDTLSLKAGNVGIGTVAPSAKLEVSGTSGIFVSDATRVSTLILNSNLADNRIYSSYTSGSELPLYLGTYSKQTAITVQPTTGNVGIGSTSPTAKLSVTGAGLTTGKAFEITDSANSPKFTVLDSGNVGVGTVSPGQKLDVRGNASISGDIQLNYGSTIQFGTSVNKINADTSNFSIRSFSNMDWDNAGTYANSAYIFKQGGAEVFRINTGGNVGIGTTTPNNLLQVANLINFDNTDFNTRLGYQSGNNLASGATSNTFVGYQAGLSSASLSTNVADFNTGVGYQALFSNTTGSGNVANGYNTLRSNTTGSFNIAIGRSTLGSNTEGQFNVGIGTDNLLGNTTGSSNLALGYLAMRSNSTGSANVALGQQSLYSNTIANSNTAIGVTSLYYTTGANNTALGASAGSYIADGSTANATGTNSVFLGYDTRANADGQTNQIVIGYGAIGNGSNSATLGNTSITKTILNGNVGIGTTSPTSVLDVYFANQVVNNSAGLGAAYFGTTDAGAINKGGSILLGGSSIDAPKVVFGSIAGRKENSTSANYAGYLQFATDNSGGTMIERMRIDSSGNVGIGTTSPLSLLNLNSETNNANPTLTISSPFNTVGTGGTIAFYNSHSSFPLGTRTMAQISLIPTVGDNTTGDFSFLLKKANTDSAPTDVFRIKNNGNVGIGSTSPSAKLSVTGTGLTTGKAFEITDSTNSPKFTVLDNGNVGIGTSFPALKLQVYGGSILVDSGQGLLFGGGANSIINTAGVLTLRAGSSDVVNVQSGYVTIGSATTYGALGVVGSNLQAGLVVLAPNAPTLDIFAIRNNANNNNYLGVSSAGNVGIGSSTPAARLSVAGAGLTTGKAFEITDSANSPKFTVLDNGNVGVGIQPGSYKLNVLGVASTSQDAYINGLRVGTGGAVSSNIILGGGLASDTQGSNIGIGALALRDHISGQGNIGMGQFTLFQNTTGANNFALGHAALSGNLTGSGNIALGYFAGANETGSNSFYVNNVQQASLANDKAYSLMYGTFSGTAGSLTGQQLVINGNLGIGTSSPTALLSLGNGSGAAGTTAALGINFGDPTANLYRLSAGVIKTDGTLNVAGNVQTIAGDFVGAAGYTFRSLGDLYLDSASATDIHLRPGASEKVTILSTGNVGIGTTSPLYKLSVQNASEGNTFQIYDTDGNCLLDPDSGGITTTCSSDIRLKTNIANANSVLPYLTNLPIKDYTVIASGEKRTGVIAQELLANYSELVSMGADGYYGVKEISSWKLIKGIQELDIKIENQIASSTEVTKSLDLRINNIADIASTTLTSIPQAPMIDIDAIASTTANSLASSDSFIGSIASSVKNLIFSTGDWVIEKITATTGYFTNLFADKVTTKELCLEDVCVTKSELQALLANMHASTTPISATSTSAGENQISGNVGTEISIPILPPVIVVPTVVATTTATTTITVDIATSTAPTIEPPVTTSEVVVPTVPEVTVETPPETPPAIIEVPVVLETDPAPITP